LCRDSVCTQNKFKIIHVHQNNVLTANPRSLAKCQKYIEKENDQEKEKIK
jgi:hypothetical protein